MPFNQNFRTSIVKKKPCFNILIFRGDIMGDTGLICHNKRYVLVLP
jgi:hypothetical protein